MCSSVNIWAGGNVSRHEDPYFHLYSHIFPLAVNRVAGTTIKSLFGPNPTRKPLFPTSDELTVYHYLIPAVAEAQGSEAITKIEEIVLELMPANTVAKGYLHRLVKTAEYSASSITSTTSPQQYTIRLGDNTIRLDKKVLGYMWLIGRLYTHMDMFYGLVREGYTVSAVDLYVDDQDDEEVIRFISNGWVISVPVRREREAFIENFYVTLTRDHREKLMRVVLNVPPKFIIEPPVYMKATLSVDIIYDRGTISLLQSKDKIERLWDYYTYGVKAVNTLPNELEQILGNTLHSYRIYVNALFRVKYGEVNIRAPGADRFRIQLIQEYNDYIVSTYLNVWSQKASCLIADLLGVTCKDVGRRGYASYGLRDPIFIVEDKVITISSSGWWLLRSLREIARHESPK